MIIVPKEKKALLGKTATGLHHTKSGKLKYPYPYQGVDNDLATTHNNYGFTNAQAGDFIGDAAMLTSGTVGKVVKITDDVIEYVGCKFVTLDGRRKSAWRRSVFVLTPEQVNEVVEYYKQLNQQDKLRMDLMEKTPYELSLMNLESYYD